jgi:hypothetical protein
MRKLFVIMLFACAVSSSENIAVMDLDADGVTVSEARTLTNKLRGELISTGVFTVIERGEMDNILKEQGFQSTGCTSQECAVEMGQLLGVQKLVAGSIGKVGAIYLVSLRMIDVAKGTIVKNAEEEIEGDISAVLRVGMYNVARKIAGLDADKTYSPVNVPEKRPIEQPQTAPADILFSRRLLLIDFGKANYKGATFTWSEASRFSQMLEDISWESGTHLGVRVAVKNFYIKEKESSFMIGCGDIGFSYEKHASSAKSILFTDSASSFFGSINAPSEFLVFRKFILSDNITLGYRFLSTALEIEPYGGIGFMCDFGVISGTLINTQSDDNLLRVSFRFGLPVGIRIYTKSIFLGMEYTKTFKNIRTVTDPSYNYDTGKTINGELSYEGASFWAFQFGVIIGK